MINTNYFLQNNNTYYKINKNSDTKDNLLPDREAKIAFTSLPLGLYNNRLISRQNFTSSTSSTEYDKGSSPEVAKKLKNLNGSLDQKLVQAKDIILEDLGLNPDLVKLIDTDCGPNAYAVYGAANGVIGYSKAVCQKQMQFSDDAIICFLRHEIDHMVVFVKIYKVLGPEGFDKFIQNNDYMKQAPPEERVVNHHFYQQMAQYLDVSDFNAQKYIDAFNNYKKGVDKTGTDYSKCRLFTSMNGSDELEDSADKAEFELEKQMGVTTLKDFYSMIEHTKILKDKISDFISQNPIYNVGNDTVEILFDYLYHKSAVETGLEDMLKNWGNILANAETKVQSISKRDIEEAYKYRSSKLMSNNNK